MAYEIPGMVVSLTAGASLASDQFKFVKLSADNTVILCSATTDTPIGILQNSPGSLGPAEVMVSGVSKLVAGGSIPFNTLVGTDAAGLGTAITSGTTGTVAYPVCRTIAGNTAANGIVTVLLGNMTRAF